MVPVGQSEQPVALVRRPTLHVSATVTKVLRAPLGLFGIAVLLLVAFVAVAAPLLAPYGPSQVGVGTPLTGPTASHLLGTDQLGRDLLTRLIFGSRISLAVGFIAVGVAAAIGLPIGLAAGYRRGFTDGLLMRLVDAIIAFPALILALGIVATIGGGLQNVMIALGIAIMPQYARVTRSQVLGVAA